MRYRFIILTLVFSSFFLLSCSKDELVNSPSEFELFGQWIVSDYYSTNGPICYDILVNDTVSFIRTGDMHDQLIFSYKLFEREYRDTFSISETTTQILGMGNYLYADSTMISPKFEKNPRQSFIITKLDYNKIDFSLKIETYDLKTDSLIFGDVSHFIARKIR